MKNKSIKESTTLPPASLMQALRDEEAKRQATTQLAIDEDNLTEYNPGVTVLTRSISFNDYDDGGGQFFDGEADYATVKKIRWPYGIEVKFNDKAREITFKTAKMKTVAKLLNKYIDFGAVSAGEVLDLPASLLGEDTPVETGPESVVKNFLQSNPTAQPNNDLRSFKEVSSAEYTKIGRQPGMDDESFTLRLNGKIVGYMEEIERDEDRAHYAFFVRADLVQATK